MDIHTPSRSIRLSDSFVQLHGREEAENKLRSILKSARFDLIEEENAFRLSGQDVSYHLVDPFLPDALNRFRRGMSMTDVSAYRSSTDHFDLCFEDSWSGHFIAKRFAEQALQADLLLIHLDDHTDMMPTLLRYSDGVLVDPSTGAPFNPTSSADWDTAIGSGAITIGNFITPLYYSGRKIHVRHIHNAFECGASEHVFCQPCEYGAIPDMQFAAIARRDAAESGSVGTYLAGSDPDKVLSGANRIWTLVHIDLDYFINDFNGASHGQSYLPNPTLLAQAKQKMVRFFHALSRMNPQIDRWLIATSPGFCSAYHWDWLLSELTGHIEDFDNTRARLI